MDAARPYYLSEFDETQKFWHYNGLEGAREHVCHDIGTIFGGYKWENESFIAATSVELHLVSESSATKPVTLSLSGQKRTQLVTYLPNYKTWEYGGQRPSFTGFYIIPSELVNFIQK